MEQLTLEIITVFGLLALTVLLFASDVIRVDIGAVVILLLLALTTLIPGLEPLILPEQIFSGFGSNAVIAIIAVMIISAGLNKTGILSIIAKYILHYGQKSERKLIALICTSAGLVSSFMQNTGAAALYIPIVSRIASRSGLALNRLLLPMGFSAIVGGTLTTVGSSPLILMNDLLPKNIEPLHLFDVTLVGIGLIITSVLYFFFFGNAVLPKARYDDLPSIATVDYLKKTYGIDAEIYEIVIPANSSVIGKTIASLEYEYALRIIATQVGNRVYIAPDRNYDLSGDNVIAAIGSRASIDKFIHTYHLQLRQDLQAFDETLTTSSAGISEILIPPDSDLIGKTISEINLRHSYGLSVLNIRRGENNHSQQLAEFTLQAGDTLVCHNRWKDLARLLNDKNFVIVTTEFPHESHRPEKTVFALSFLCAAIGLVLFTPLPLSVSLLFGAIGMVLTGVIKMDEAYEAINWMTVFLLACLIPVGLAVENSGAANWIAQSALALMGDVPTWALLALVGFLASLFSLTLSNVGATVLLVPLVVNLAITFDADPRLFALTTAVCASNSFILPTHQVNALIMGPGNYKVRDYVRAGPGMTLLYLVVSLLILYFTF